MKRKPTTTSTADKMTISIAPFATKEVREYLTKTAKECGLTVDHLASAFLLEAIENRQLLRKEGRFADRIMTVEMDARLADSVVRVAERHKCDKDTVIRMALRNFIITP